jgi:probable F420-dependent oxidoreductase
MHFGVAMFPTDYAICPDDLARELEARRFESFWVPEHSHIPANRRSQWPGGAALPREYWHTYDPFVALAMAAAATTRLKLATGICLVIERDPIITAKEVASLDHLSGGRFIFGIGGGWNTEEMEDHGTPFKARWRVMRERILAMKELWTKEEAEFHGEFVMAQTRPDASSTDPDGRRRPHDPRSRDRILRWLDARRRAGRERAPRSDRHLA